ncbi:hypothetical protein CROQUDRAFT_656486 [Cronartium quercuum f. sp. fusiforme G11]|uniref:Dyp-type peroxidase n=1 Tax=Cronartium quercuum f. sp. fusiforme G11 TaxID=708437 RepID=A0A9P6TDS3_9BASI|nr:hypothetical protein CROQUDRAFT_656486 [Cronartium quercuum f. sp. fusiforme G11]
MGSDFKPRLLPDQYLVSASDSKMDENEVQGDIVLGFRKRVQAFLLISITDLELFRRLLRDILAPLLTSTAEVRAAAGLIGAIKAYAPPGTLKPFTSTQLAFSARALLHLGIPAEALPAQGAFRAGQAHDARINLADPVESGKLAHWRPQYENASIDGLLTVTAPDSTQLELELGFLRNVIAPATKIVLELKSAVRPGSAAGKEHFGYKDGVSNPRVAGMEPMGNQAGEGRAVDASVIITGLKAGQPSWTRNGSFLVFRELQQLVPEFDAFCHSSGKISKPDEIGARLMGRWKSGAPVSLSPHTDDLKLASAQGFDYADPAELKQARCPYVAHIRKANPRNGLGNRKELIDPHLMIRASIPYGPEVSQDERDSNATKQERGLFFICYQSSIEAGFQFVQKVWCNNQKFPSNEAGIDPGFDLIVGQNYGKSRTAQNVIDKGVQGDNDPLNTVTTNIQFVVPKGGEYFFVPSISTVRNTLGA